MKVLIVDDHLVVREGLRRILETDSLIEVVGEARNGEEAVAKAAALLPDVILMDLMMPGMDGITATRRIKEAQPEANVLILTLHSDDSVMQAIEAGATGYLLKDTDPDRILEGIHQVREGLSPMAPSVTHDLILEFARLSRDDRRSILDVRQQAIMRMLAEGVSTRGIGEHLHVSPSTVKREIRQVFDKLKVNDRAQAVAEAMRRQLI